MPREALVFCLVLVSASGLLGQARSGGAKLGQEAPRHEQEATKLALSAEDYAKYRKWLRPPDSVEAWQRIPWRTAFAPALLEASRGKKPVLLWAMNGHPLGCT